MAFETLLESLNTVDDLLPKMSMLMEVFINRQEHDTDNFRLKETPKIANNDNTIILHGYDRVYLSSYRAFLVQTLEAKLNVLDDERYSEADKQTMFNTWMTHPDWLLQLDEVYFDDDTNTSYRVNIFWKFYYWQLNTTPEYMLYYQEVEALYKPHIPKYVMPNEPISNLLIKAENVLHEDDKYLLPIIVSSYVQGLYGTQRYTKYVSAIRLYIQRIEMNCVVDMETLRLKYNVTVHTSYGTYTHESYSTVMPSRELESLQFTTQSLYDSLSYGDSVDSNITYYIKLLTTI